MYIKDAKDNIQRLSSDFVIYSVGFQNSDEITKKFKGICKEFYVLGDAKEPGRIKEAVHESERVARII